MKLWSGLRRRLSHLLERILVGRAVHIVRERLIDFSTLSKPLKRVVWLSYLGLALLALLLLLRPVLQRTQNWDVVAFSLPAGVVIAAAFIMVPAFWALITGIILSNRVLRFSLIILLALFSPFLAQVAKRGAIPSPRSYFTFSAWWLVLAFEIPPALLLIAAVLRSRAGVKLIATLCGLACLIWVGLTIFICRYQPAFAAFFISFSIVPMAFAMPAAFMTVGFDLAEWGALLGGFAADGLQESRKLLIVFASAVAIFANAMLSAHALDWQHRGVITARFAIFIVLIIVLGIVSFRASREAHLLHLRRLKLLGMAALVLVGAYGSLWSRTVAPGPDYLPGYRIFKLEKYYIFSVAYPQDWEVEILAENKGSAGVRFFGNARILTILVQSRDVGPAPSYLNEITPGGDQLPRTPLRFREDTGGWEKFETDLTAKRPPRAAINAIPSTVADERSHQKLFAGAPAGVVLKQIDPKGPAAAAGLQPLDLVTSIDGKKVTTPGEFRDEISHKSVGQQVQLNVWRAGEIVQVPVTVKRLEGELLKHFIVWHRTFASTDYYLNTDWYIVTETIPPFLSDGLRQFRDVQKSFLLGNRTIAWPARRTAVFIVWGALALGLLLWLFLTKTPAYRWTVGILLAIAGSVLAMNVTTFNHETEPNAISQTFHCAQLIVSGATLFLLCFSLRRRHEQRRQILRLALFINIALLCLNGFLLAYNLGAEAGERSYTWRAIVILVAFGWEIASSGDLVNHGTRWFPRVSRILLFCAYVTIAAGCAFLFVRSHYWFTREMEGFDGEHWVTLGLLLLGLPFILHLFAFRCGLLLREQMSAARPLPSGDAELAAAQS